LRKSIFANPDECTGCGICELVCTGFHEKKYGVMKSRIRNVKIGDTIRMPMTCRLCDKPPCVAVCARDALRQDTNTGVIIVDEKRCTGCGWCIQSCQFGAILFHPTKRVPIICDLCDGNPACVKECPKEALETTTLDAFSSKIRKSAVKDLIRVEEEIR
jgi:carbon-monoxide dehydrogenase iron sulfur subunit